MLLRIVKIQPPIEVMRMVKAGRIACIKTSPMNDQFHDGSTVSL